MTSNSNAKWPLVKNIFTKAAEEHIGYKRTSRKTWILDNTWNLIDQRSAAKNIWNAAKTRSSKTTAQQNYSRLDKLVKKGARNDKRQWSSQIATKAQAAAETYRTRDLFKLIRQLTNNNPPTSKPLMDSNGVTTTSKEKQTLIWERYYRNLLSDCDQNTPNICSCQHHEDSTQFDITCPSIAEIASAISTLKSNKAAGPDNIHPEFLKADRTLSAELLQPLISEFWSEETLNAELVEGTIVLLPKKGNLSDCRNWRGITLLSVINKIISQIINKRLTEYVSPSMRNEQAGFRAHRSCVDHVNTLRIIVEQSVEWRTSLYLCFIDFQKAFDTIKHEAIYRTLQCKGVPGKIIRLIRALYNGATCRISHGGLLSDQIHIQKGVRQGCVLSPLLFNIVLDTLMSRVSQHNRGITWGINGKLSDLDYADDICLLAHKHSDINEMLNDVVKCAAQVGLQINIPKTKIMRINCNNHQPLTVDGTPINTVESFCYLGSIITNTGGSADDIRSRINKGRAAFGSLEKTWRSSQISRDTKIRIFNACVKSAVLYGCETWNAPKKELQTLQAFINRCLRRIMRVYWPNKITNENLWATTNQEPVSQEIRRRKWKWIGHTLRKPQDDIARVALDWNPQGSRRKGRPANTWRRQVDAEIKEKGHTRSEIRNLALDRIKWNNFVMALCSS